MNSAPVVSITDELLAEIEREAVVKAKACAPLDTLRLIKELRRLRAELEALRLEADYANNNHMASLMLVADIRAAAGDPEGRLMQPELVKHIDKLRKMAGTAMQSNT